MVRNLIKPIVKKRFAVLEAEERERIRFTLGYEDKIYHRSYAHNLSSCEIKASIFSGFNFATA